MKQTIAIFLALSILILSGCRNAGPAGEMFISIKLYNIPFIILFISVGSVMSLLSFLVLMVCVFPPFIPGQGR